MVARMVRALDKQVTLAIRHAALVQRVVIQPRTGKQLKEAETDQQLMCEPKLCLMGKVGEQVILQP